MYRIHHVRLLLGRFGVSSGEVAGSKSASPYLNNFTPSLLLPSKAKVAETNIAIKATVYLVSATYVFLLPVSY